MIFNINKSKVRFFSMFWKKTINLKALILLFAVLLIFCKVSFAMQQNVSDLPSSYVKDDERDNINVYKHASKAVVTIKSLKTMGSGCIIDPAGIVVTNKHVIGTNYVVNLSMSDGSSYNANVIDIDNDDIVLLKINSNRQFPFIRLGDSSKIEVGQKVLAIGNPFGLERTLTTGIISRLDYKLNRIQTDAAINPGNSGGPLLNNIGELIGINQAILNPSGKSSAGIGFAIPSNTVKRLLVMTKNTKVPSKKIIPNNNIGNNNTNNSSYSGIVYQTKVFLGVAGQTTRNGNVVVTGVAQGSPADQAGIQFQDIILSVDTTQIKAFDDIGFALKDKKAGDRINLLYMRNGVVNSMSVTLVGRNQ